jgi:putative ABC transport system ATP-binding protein
MLELKNICISFNDHQVLKKLSCHAKNGDFIVIVGANGAGKSTFFDTIAGKCKPQSGSIKLNNENITNLNELQRTGMITRIFQNTKLNSASSLTVIQNLAISQYSRRNVRLINGMQAMPRARAAKIISELGMNINILDKKMSDLSGGQRQLIAFAMATQAIPKVLLLDEPTAALDPQASTQLLSYAARFIKKHNITTLLITHDPQIALSLGNKIWILENGVISKEFSADDKQTLKPNQLIGQIDYDKLSA